MDVEPGGDVRGGPVGVPTAQARDGGGGSTDIRPGYRSIALTPLWVVLGMAVGSLLYALTEGDFSQIWSGLQFAPVVVVVSVVAGLIHRAINVWRHRARRGA